jgi:hypothetical protein
MADHGFKFGQAGRVFGCTFRNGGGLWLGVLCPKEAQAACHRQRRDRRENRTAHVGFNNFEEALDRPSHNIASHLRRSETSTCP